MTDNEIIKALECCSMGSYPACRDCPYHDDYVNRGCINKRNADIKDLISRQKAEIESARRKALLEATRKFAGHSDYHGDTILCILKCMAEGKETETARPLNKKEIKTEAIKEFAEKLKKRTWDITYIDNLVKEMTVEKEREN